MTVLAFYLALAAARLVAGPGSYFAHCDEMELRLPSGAWVSLDGTQPARLTAIYRLQCAERTAP